jgi:hypothetical protein
MMNPSQKYIYIIYAWELAFYVAVVMIKIKLNQRTLKSSTSERETSSFFFTLCWSAHLGFPFGFSQQEQRSIYQWEPSPDVRPTIFILTFHKRGPLSIVALYNLYMVVSDLDISSWPNMYHVWCINIYIIYIYTLWLCNIAMEHGQFIDGLPITNGDFPWQTVSHNQMLHISYMALTCKRRPPGPRICTVLGWRSGHQVFNSLRLTIDLTNTKHMPTRHQKFPNLIKSSSIFASTSSGRAEQKW